MFFFYDINFLYFYLYIIKDTNGQKSVGEAMKKQMLQLNWLDTVGDVCSFEF